MARKPLRLSIELRKSFKTNRAHQQLELPSQALATRNLISSRGLRRKESTARPSTLILGKRMVLQKIEATGLQA